MKKLTLSLTTIYVALSIAFTACSSAPKGSAEVPVDKVEREYVLRERNPDPAPEWVTSWARYRDERESKGGHYFVGDSDDMAQQSIACTVAAQAARRRAAEQIATFIKSKLGSNVTTKRYVDKYDSSRTENRNALEEQLVSESAAMLTGSKVLDEYWEQRDYSKVGGNRAVYQCKALIKISDKDMDEAIRRTGQKVVTQDADPAAKAAVKEMLKNVDSEFNAYRGSN